MASRSNHALELLALSLTTNACVYAIYERFIWLLYLYIIYSDTNKHTDNDELRSHTNCTYTCIYNLTIRPLYCSYTHTCTHSPKPHRAMLSSLCAVLFDSVRRVERTSRCCKAKAFQLRRSSRTRRIRHQNTQRNDFIAIHIYTHIHTYIYIHSTV